MLIRVCAFSNKGWNLYKQIEKLDEEDVFEIIPKEEIEEFLRSSFEYSLPILFIGAVGIAVRKIAPFINNKLTDSPVIVIDDMGKYVIPILAGHVGGANELAVRIANIINATSVITTSTDINDKFAVDIFAKKNGLRIVNKDGIKEVSSKLLKDENIYIYTGEYETKKPLGKLVNVIDEDYLKNANSDSIKADVYIGKDYMKDALNLYPKEYVIGIGCKKNTEFDLIEEAIINKLNGLNIDITDVAAVASIDLKKKEKGLLRFTSKYHLSFITYSAEELNEVEGEFAESEFVKNTTGVGNVCERAAVRCAGADCEIICHKESKKEITIAIVKRKVIIGNW